MNYARLDQTYAAKHPVPVACNFTMLTRKLLSLGKGTNVRKRMFREQNIVLEFDSAQFIATLDQAGNIYISQQFILLHVMDSWFLRSVLSIG